MNIFIQFLRDRRGVAAVEAAFVIPVLVILLFGSVGAFDLFRADRSISHSANTVVDLASRMEVMNDQNRDALFATGQALLGKFSSNSDYAISLASILNDGTQLTVVWSEANANGAEIVDGELASLDLPDIPENESVIFVRVENNYAPIFGSGLDFDRESSRRPRFVAQIAYDTGP